ncbi:MAG: hypothetical protein ACHQFW_08085, partial [Chitinophagales bacterium]
VRGALFEGPALLAAVLFLNTGGDVFLYIYTAMAAMLIFYFPTKNRVREDLELSEEELNSI